jgi:hypothetical protein
MKPIPEFQQLEITLFAKEIVPAFMTSKFLKESRIIPKEWEFAQPPEIDAQAGKVAFTNDVFISANVGVVIFSEKFDGTNTSDVKIPSLVSKWVKTLSKFDYQVVEINFSSFFTFEGKNNDNFCNYISTSLLANGAWKEVSEQPLRASLSLAYTLKQKEFSIKIDDVQLRNSKNSLESGVMFSGNFPYEVAGNTAAERIKYMNQLLELWHEDLEIYQDIVDKKFLNLSGN